MASPQHLPRCQPNANADPDVYAYAIGKSDTNGNIYSYCDADSKFYSDTHSF
jgi:hypothetical protein